MYRLIKYYEWFALIELLLYNYNASKTIKFFGKTTFYNGDAKNRDNTDTYLRQYTKIQGQTIIHSKRSRLRLAIIIAELAFCCLIDAVSKYTSPGGGVRGVMVKGCRASLLCAKSLQVSGNLGWEGRVRK